MMKLTLAFAGAAIVAATALTGGPSTTSAAETAIISKKSAHGVVETIDRLEKALTANGITIFTRVDHAKGAKSVDLELAPTLLLVFGNPKLGTPLMQSNRAIGLDLPLKALAWEDANGDVYLSYTSPDALKARHEIADRDKVFENMAKALDGMTTTATKAE